MNKKLFGLIGDGQQAKLHRKAIDALGHEIVEVYDVTKPRPTCVDSNFYKSLDYVVISTPPVHHYHWIKQALMHNTKVIVEKPMVLPWQPFIDDDRINVVLQLRWKNFTKIKRVTLRALRGEEYQKSWKADYNQTGGMFFELLIHYIDLAMKYEADFEGIILANHPEGQIKLADDVKLDSNHEMLYFQMYQDIVDGHGVKPYEVARLHYVLSVLTGVYGGTLDKLFGKRISIKSSEWRGI